jgi:hypothetical protein
LSYFSNYRGVRVRGYPVRVRVDFVSYLMVSVHQRWVIAQLLN